MNGKFSETLKRADTTPIFKKGNDNEKENCRPLSMLSAFSEVFEKLLFEQINDHMQSKFSKHLTCALFLDLSKVFDTLDPLLLAKLCAYGFDNNSLSFV